MSRRAFIPDGKIEKAAEKLLEEYGREAGPVLLPPVPVEEILENHLHYNLDFDDLGKILGAEGALGATWPEERSVYVDSSLDPARKPGAEGILRFTVAHEVGHIVLHGADEPVDADQTDLFPPGDSAPRPLCRAKGERSPREIQADRFAAALLMPKAFIGEIWRSKFGTLDPKSCDPALWGRLRERNPMRSHDEVTDMALAPIAAEFARIFSVSTQAMRIRLETLGLLRREEAPPRLLSISALSDVAE